MARHELVEKALEMLKPEEALRLLAKKPEAVRRADRVPMEPGAPNAKAAYWEAGTGRVLGPATPKFLARDGDQFWISLTFKGQVYWINADWLRSCNAFEKQAKPRKVEPI